MPGLMAKVLRPGFTRVNRGDGGSRLDTQSEAFAWRPAWTTLGTKCLPPAPVGTGDRLSSWRLMPETQAGPPVLGSPAGGSPGRGYMVSGFQERFIITSAPNICGQRGHLPTSPRRAPNPGRVWIPRSLSPEETGCSWTPT